jgi:hypothetical protein
MTLKTHLFLEANARSPVVYGSVDGNRCTYRLRDGSVWTLSRREAAGIGHPRWAHLEASYRAAVIEREWHAPAIKEYRANERALLDKLSAEALQSEHHGSERR